METKSIIIILIYLFWNPSIYGCTIFSIKQDEKVYVGNNEDWYIPYPKYRIITGGKGTYGRIVFSYNDNWGQGGMNEKGLFFDWVLKSEESITWERDSSKKNLLGSLSEKILSKCTSVEEALKYYEEYNEPIFKISYIVLVDTSGHTAFVSWNENKINIENCKGVCVGGNGFDEIVEKYKEIGGSINKKKMSLLLDEAHQEGEYPTLYSNIYDLKRGLIHLYYFHNYEEELVLNLKEELKKGNHSVNLDEVFKTQIPRNVFRELQKNYVLKELKTISLKGWLIAICIISLIVMISVYIFKMVLKRVK